jgi:fumarylpyruvate hydrolase
MSKKMPWEPGKSFDQSAPCSAITPASKVGHLSKARIQLKVNDQVHQDDDISAMIYDVPSIIAFLSKSVALAAGDIIYTGTPAGSGPVVSGDRMVGTIEQLGALTITVA